MPDLSPEMVIAHAIRYDHRLGEEARRIIQALADHGYTITRTDLPAILDVYSSDRSNTSMFAGAKVGRRPVSSIPSRDLTLEKPAATTPDDLITTESVRKRYSATMIRLTGVDPLANLSA